MNLTICQECNENPAVYGDGLTWSRCPGCQLKHVKGEEPEAQEPVQNPSDSFEHKIVEGLVSIILPVYMTNYSLFHYTGNCIGSVREHTPEGDFELVVVDNGSPIQPPIVNSYYAHRVIKNEDNLGVTKAWNQGIRMSVGEYIVLLNNDVQVFDGWLEDMKNELDAGLDSGAWSLVMAHPMYSLTEPFARALEAEEVRFGNRKLDHLDRDFSCVMFKRSLIEEIGSFDELFFSYCSDSDFIKRMEEAGKKYKMLDHVATSHISDATGYSMPDTPELMNKDKEAYKQKWDNRVVEVKKEDIKGGIQVGYKGLVRTPETGDSIFFTNGGKYHHITSPEVLESLGFHFGDEVTMTIKELALSAKPGEPITMGNYQTYA